MTITCICPEPQDENSRRAVPRQSYQHNGKDESGYQMTLFDSASCQNPNIPEVNSVTDLKAQRLADEAFGYLTVYPSAFPAAMEYANECVRDNSRIETHALIVAVKEAGGNVVEFNNNHAPFLRRLLAADNECVAACMECRKSMFDDIDINHYLTMLHNQQAKYL